MNLLLQPIINKDIILKQFTLSDALLLFALTDKNRAYLKEWLAWLDKTQSVEDTKKFIENSLELAKQEKAADFGIYYKDILVGAIGYHMIDTINKKTVIGYWLDQQSQGKGIMTNATKMLLDFAFNDLQLNRVQITCAVGNNKSCAIPKKLGFTKEGTARQNEWLYDHFVDWELYSILKTEWKSSKYLLG